MAKPSKFNPKIGKKITSMRKQKKTMAEIAEAVGVSKTTVATWIEKHSL